MAGQVLDVPAGVSRSSNTASTFKPYDPKEALGDTTPIQPQPVAPKKKGCGVLGTILLAVIAIAVVAILKVPVTAFFVGTAAPGSAAFVAGSIAAAATVGAAASVVSQGVGVLTGIQDGFSWKAVGLAAVSAGVSEGLDQAAAGIPGLGFLGGGDVPSDFARGAFGSAISQGIGIATGLQTGFDWTGVAAAGVEAAAGGATGGQLGTPGSRLGAFGQTVLVNAAGGIANAATRSVIAGTDFGDNVIAALPDIIAQTVGDLIAPPQQSTLLFDDYDPNSGVVVDDGRPIADGDTDDGWGQQAPGPANMGQSAQLQSASSTPAPPDANVPISLPPISTSISHSDTDMAALDHAYQFLTSNGVYGPEVDYVDYTAEIWDSNGNPTSAVVDTYSWDDTKQADVLISSTNISSKELGTLTASGSTDEQIANYFVNGLQEISKLGANAIPIASLSPKLVTELSDLSQKGVVVEPNSPGSSTSPNGYTIQVDGYGSVDVLVSQLSHEVGHSLYSLGGFVPSLSSKQAYLTSALGNEGMATINNVAVQREIISNGGG